MLHECVPLLMWILLRIGGGAGRGLCPRNRCANICMSRLLRLIEVSRAASSHVKGYLFSLW
ncbi:hypothetical protein HMPREF1980_01714 [Actinomyces sp. oral taxon 172 str. F0311]|nr:hypothetical protein HMPREF1980_01714 [Actinomyces sp. oral taxon 172 str. F0311]